MHNAATPSMKMTDLHTTARNQWQLLRSSAARDNEALCLPTLPGSLPLPRTQKGAVDPGWYTPRELARRKEIQGIHPTVPPVREPKRSQRPPGHPIHGSIFAAIALEHSYPWKLSLSGRFVFFRDISGGSTSSWPKKQSKTPAVTSLTPLR
ncbi:hypothetical protein D3C71_1154580 [compost metagenome]